MYATRQIIATDLTVGMMVDRRYSDSPNWRIVSIHPPRTLNDGSTVVSVSYGGGEGGTFYAHQMVTVVDEA